MIKQELVIWTIDDIVIRLETHNPLDLLRLKYAARFPGAKVVIENNVGDTMIMDIKGARYEYYDEDEKRQKTKGNTW